MHATTLHRYFAIPRTDTWITVYYVCSTLCFKNTQRLKATFCAGCQEDVVIFINYLLINY